MASAALYGYVSLSISPKSEDYCTSSMSSTKSFFAAVLFGTAFLYVYFFHSIETQTTQSAAGKNAAAVNVYKAFTVKEFRLRHLYSRSFIHHTYRSVSDNNTLIGIVLCIRVRTMPDNFRGSIVRKQSGNCETLESAMNEYKLISVRFDLHMVYIIRKTTNNKP